MKTWALKQIGKVLTEKIYGQYEWIEPVDLIGCFKPAEVHVIKSTIEEKYEFVTNLFFNTVVSNAFASGLRNRSLVMYELVDNVCVFFNSLGISKEDMVCIVNMIIRADHSLNDDLYRNVNAVKDRMIDPRKLVFGKRLEIFCKPYEYRPIFYNGIRYNAYNVSKRKNYITPYNASVNGTTLCLRRELYKDFIDKRLRSDMPISFKDGNHTNNRLSNIVLTIEKKKR